MSSDKPTYLLRLSSEHAHAVQRAVAFYHRLAMGDTREIAAEFEGKNGDWKQQRQQGLDETLDRLQQILFPDLTGIGHNYGYGSDKTGTTGQLLYEVSTAMRHRIAWTERPLDSNTYSRDHDEPILFPSPVAEKPQCATTTGDQPELTTNGMRLAKEIEELLGTTNIKEAANRIREWKILATAPRLCDWCRKPLTPREGEKLQNFINRNYCSRTHAAYHRNDKRRRRIP